WFDTQQQGQQQVNGNAAYGQQMQGQGYQAFAQQPQQQMQVPQTNPYASFTTGTLFSPTPAPAGSVNMNGGTGGYNPFLSNSAPPMQKPSTADPATSPGTGSSASSIPTATITLQLPAAVATRPRHALVPSTTSNEPVPI
ncbi:hypothetical protein C7212DRAFT_322085, partial [Tuber magnatum]